MDRQHDEKLLDHAVEKTFPASDPVAPKHVTGTEPPGSDPRRQPPSISRTQIEAAAQPTEVCSLCNGTGKIAADEPDAEDCPQCNGLGRVVRSTEGIEAARPETTRSD